MAPSMTNQSPTPAERRKKHGTCDACGTVRECTHVRTTNGNLHLCGQCLSDINRKNPLLTSPTHDLAAEWEKVRPALERLNRSIETCGGVGSPYKPGTSPQAEHYDVVAVVDFLMAIRPELPRLLGRADGVWTDKVPTEPGWYWIRNDCETRAVKVERNGCHGALQIIGVPVERHVGQWCGPLTPPA